MATAARAGRLSGSTTRQKIHSSEPPSILAASSRSSGIDFMYWRSRKMANALTTDGTISPQ